MKRSTTLLIAAAFIVVAAGAYLIGKNGSDTNATAVVAAEMVAADTVKKETIDLKKQMRKYWKKYFCLNEFTYTPWDFFGGFKEQVAIVENKSNYIVEKMQLTITYTLADEKTKQSQIVDVDNLQPGEVRNVEIEDWKRGKKIKCNITYINCSELGQPINN